MALALPAAESGRVPTSASDPERSLAIGRVLGSK